MPPELVSAINGGQSRLDYLKASSISWSDDGKGYFLKLRGSKQWTLDLPDGYPHQIEELRKSVRDFDLGLKVILFGHAGTHIYIFERGFVAHFEGSARHTDHPLHQVRTICE